MWSLYTSFMPGFPNLGIIVFELGSFLCGGLPCALLNT